MVKFSKQFEGQLVPEWKEAFVDYWQLKKDIKKIHLLDNTNNKGNNTSSTKKQKHISFASTFISSLGKKFSSFGQHQHREHHGAIQVLNLSLPFS